MAPIMEPLDKSASWWAAVELGRRLILQLLILIFPLNTVNTKNKVKCVLCDIFTGIFDSSARSCTFNNCFLFALRKIIVKFSGNSFTCEHDCITVVGCDVYNSRDFIHFHYRKQHEPYYLVVRSHLLLSRFVSFCCFDWRLGVYI